MLNTYVPSNDVVVSALKYTSVNAVHPKNAACMADFPRVVNTGNDAVVNPVQLWNVYENPRS